MAVPEQVQRAIDKANELISQVNAPPGEPTPPSVPDVPAPEAVAAPVVPVAAPAVEAPAPSVPAAPPAEPDWAHKYSTLQGVLNAEQKRFKTELDTLRARLAELEAAAKAPVIPAPAATVPKGFDPKDVDTYGQELLDTISRIADQRTAEQVRATMAQLAPQLEQTRTQVANLNTQVYQSEADKFYGELAKAVPDYTEINADPRWLAWLGEVDSLSGVARQVYLDNAAETMDHTRTANLFNAFKQTIAAPAAPAPARAAAPSPSPSPRPVGSASAPSIQQPVTSVTRTEIAGHYGRAARDAVYRSSQAHTDFEVRMQQALATNQVIEA